MYREFDQGGDSVILKGHTPRFDIIDFNGAVSLSSSAKLLSYGLVILISAGIIKLHEC